MDEIAAGQHCNVPAGESYQGEGLGCWLSNQRQAMWGKRKNSMTEEQMSKLQGLADAGQLLPLKSAQLTGVRASAREEEAGAEEEPVSNAESSIPNPGRVVSIVGGKRKREPPHRLRE